jgi:hypothetical protein
MVLAIWYWGACEAFSSAVTGSRVGAVGPKAAPVIGGGASWLLSINWQVKVPPTKSLITPVSCSIWLTVRPSNERGA